MFTNSIENSDQNLFDAFAGMFGEDHQPYTSMFSLDDNTDVIRNESYENCDNVNSPSRDALIGDCTPDFGGFVFSQENVATKDESLPILLPADTPPHHSIESEDFSINSSSSIFPSLQSHSEFPSAPVAQNNISKSNKMVNEEEIKSSPVFGSYSLLQYAQQSASNFLPMPFLEFEKPTQPKSSFAITNIVSVVNLNCYIDLSSAVRLCRNCEYNPKRFSGMIMKIKTPKATAIVFSNGKLVCLGTKSVEESKTAAKKFAKTIKQLGYEVRFTGFRVVNIISSASCGHVVSLERMSLKSKLDCDYEPEIFPGLIYRMNNPKVTIVIFLSGKFNILGARTCEDAVKAYYSIIPQLRNFEKIA